MVYFCHGCAGEEEHAEEREEDAPWVDCMGCGGSDGDEDAGKC